MYTEGSILPIRYNFREHAEIHLIGFICTQALLARMNYAQSLALWREFKLSRMHQYNC